MKVRIKFYVAQKGEFKQEGGSIEIPFSWSDVEKFSISEEYFVKNNFLEIDAQKINNIWFIKSLQTIEKTIVTQNSSTKTMNKEDVKNEIPKKIDSVNISSTHILPIFVENQNFYLFLNKPHHREVGNLYTQEHLKSNNIFDVPKDPKYKEKVELKNKQLGERKLKLENFSFSGIDLKKLQDRHTFNAKKLLGEKNIDTSIHLKPEWRLALGIGGASVYETSITLHHIYGIPYIPASAVKGIVRSWIITEYFGSENQTPEEEKDFPLLNAEFRAYQNESFCRIFGCPSDYEKIEFVNENPIFKMKNGKKKYTTKKIDVALKNKKGEGQENEGKITFFDAFPTNKINISLDIMNVHYKDYYESKKNDNGVYENVKPPADWSSPNIINFLTVQNTHFQFLVGAKNQSDLKDLKIDHKNIVEWLASALKDRGIGAKTAVGYGYMQ